MNKNQYRIIFNKARGMMVVVAETVISDGSSSGNTSGKKSTISSQDTQQSTQWIKLTQSLRLTRLSTLCLLMSGITLSSSIVQAQIIADANAPINQQAVILKTPNGLPQINIQTPNAAGVSVNTYSQFDVEKAGAILNNSVNGARTNLAGWVQGNPLLTQSANIILNQVNSTNPSQLSGYLEVAGQRAQVIVANPSGINCNGCGFINASRATLTTGTPVFNNGSLESYRVNQGTITVGGQGLDGTTADYTDLIAHAIQINAGIWANQLNVITGANTVGAANTVSGSNISVAQTTASEATPQFGIDVAALGGMYAGQITLVGTEAGLGVRNAGQIGTTAGDIVVNADGQLQNSGTIYSKGNTSISANSDISNSGTLASAKNLTVSTNADLNNSGTMAATAQLTITNAGTVSNAGTSKIYGGTVLNLQASELTNAGQIVSGSTASITVQNNINNAAGVIDAQRLVLNAKGDLNNQGGQIIQTGNTGLDITTSKLTNNQAGVIGQPIVTNTSNSGTTGTGTTNSGSSTSSTGNSSSSTSSSGSTTTGSTSGAALSNGTLQVTGVLNNTAGSILTVGSTNITTQNLDNTAGQLSLGQLNITGSSFINDKGQVLVTQNLTSQATQLSNQSGAIAVGGTLNAQATQIQNQKGNIQAGVLQLMANQLDNTQGILLQTGTNSSATISVQDQLIQQEGQIESAGNLNIKANNLTGTQGQITTLGDLNLTGTNISLVNGLVRSNGQASLSGTTIDNTEGQIRTNQQITLNANTLNNVGGTIQSLGNVNLTILGDLDNSAGSISSTQNGTVQTGGNILSGGVLTAAVSGLLNNNQGTLGSIGTATTSQFNIQAQSLNNEQGLILQANNTQANNVLNIATPYAQQNGQIQTQGNLNFTAPSLTLNNQALTVLGNLNLSSGATNFSNATLYIGGNASLTTADLNNNNGSLTAKGGLNITSSSLENIGGIIQSNGSMTIQTTGLLNNALLGQILSAQDININSQGINNVDGTIAGNNITVNTNGLELENYYGSIIVANGNLSLNTGAIANDAGLLQAGKDLTINTNGQVISNTDSPQSAETPISQSSLPFGLFSPAYFISNTGLAYQYLGNLSDPLIATNVQGVSTLSPSVSYDYNGITATFSLIPNTTGPNQIDLGDNTSTTTANSAYQLTGLSLDNNLPPPDHTTGILSGTSLAITSGLLNNTNGVIATQGSLNFNIAGLVNSSGLIQSTNDLSINITPSALIPFTGDFGQWNNNTNFKGKIESTAGNLNITDFNHTFWNGLGLISAAQDINLNLQSLINASVYYDGDGVRYHQGGTIVANNINIIAGIDITNAGTGIIAANNNVYLESGNLNILAGQASTGYTLTTQGGNIKNYDSLIQAGQTLTINTNESLMDNEQINQASSPNLGLVASTIQLQNVDTLENTANIYSTNTLNININYLWVASNSGNITTSNDLNITAGNFALNGSLIAKNNITLTETQAGAWFDNAGQINAQQGQVDIQANQTRFGNDGQIVAGTNINVDALGLFNNGVIYAPKIRIETNNQSLDNMGGARIVAANTLDINSGVLTNDSSLIQAGQALRLNVNGQNLTNTNDTAATSTNPLGIIATNLQLQNISTLDNSNGIIYTPNNLNLNLTRLKNLGGSISSGDQLTLTTSGSIYNMHGSLVSANDLQVTSGSLINNAGGQIGSTTGDVTLSAIQGIIDNTANGQITSAANVSLNSQGLNNGGVIYAPNVQIETNNQAINNTQGGAIKGNTVAINSGVLTNDASLIQAGQALTINTNGQNIYNNNDQNATTSNPLGIIATNLQLQNLAVLSNSGVIYTPNDLNLNLTQLINETGNISTGGKLNINSSEVIDNGYGTLSAVNAIQLTGTLISNYGGQIGSTTADINLNATQGAIDNTGYGQIISPTAIVLNSQGMDNGGAISATNIQIKTNNQPLINTQDGTIVAGNTLEINTGGSTSNGLVDNKGLINASTTLITAGTISNIGGNAKIYGDKIAIATQTLNNTPANGAAPVIAARQDMELGVQTLNNDPNLNPNTILTTNNGAMILSLGNLNIGGSLDSNNNAIGQAQQVNNLSATIQSVGSMNINTANLLNKDVYFAYAPVTTASTTKDYWTLNSSVFYQEDYGSTFGMGVSQAQVNLGQLNGSGQGIIYVYDRSQGSINTIQNNNTGVQLWSNYGDSSRANIRYAEYTQNGVTYQADNYTEFRTTQTTTRDEATVSDPAQILVGGDLNLLGKTFTTNQNSQIIVGGNLIANLSNLNNIATQGTTTIHETGSYDNYYVNRRSCCHDRTLTTGWLAYNPADIVTTSAVIGAGGSIQSNTASTPNGTAGNSTTNTQQGFTNTSGGYSGNNTSPLISLTAQTTAVTGAQAQIINDTPSLTQPANDAAPALAPILTPAQITQQINTAQLSSQTNALNQPPQVKGILATLPNLNLPQIALYQINSSPSATYIVETDPRFLSPTNTGNLASADTLLQSLQTTSNITQKQIGDAFYQQQLINQQIGALTGKAFISGYNTTNSEYAALLTNGATFAKQEGLTVGLGLTAAQMAQLTSDIVWLVSEPVTLPDGTVENVLVPQVYLLPQAGTVSSNGALISANQIQLNTTGNVTNSGTIAGEQAVVINANNISNTGNIAGTQVGLAALNDLNNLGGTISADQNLVLKAGNNIDISSTTDSSSNTFGLSSSSQTSLDRIAGLYVGGYGTGGKLTVIAGNNLDVNGTQINNQSAGGVTNLLAGNNIQISPLQLASQLDLIRNSSNYTNLSTTIDYSSTISSLGDLNINAGGILSAMAAQITSGGNLDLSGALGVLIANGNNTSQFSAANTTKDHGFLGSTTTRNSVTDNNGTVVASNLSAGGTLSVDSKTGDIMLQAANLSGSTINLSSLQGVIDLLAGYNVDQSQSTFSSKISGLGQAASWGGVVGTMIAGSDGMGQGMLVNQTGQVSTLTAGSGGINIQAQGNITSQGTDFTSGGNITLSSSQGQVILGAVNNLLEQASNSSTTNPWLVSSNMGSTTSKTSQLSQMQYTGQLVVNAAQGIQVDVPVSANNGNTPSTQSIQDVVSQLAQQPNMSWLANMQANGQVDYNQIQQIYEHQHQSSTNLGVESQLVIAIAVTVATAGTGTAATVSAMTAATTAVEGSLITAAIVDTSNSLLSGQGLNGAVNTFFSKNTLENATAAALTAGIAQEVTNNLGISSSTLTNIQDQTLPTTSSISTVFTKNLINSVSGALVNQVIYGGNLGQNLEQAGLSAVGNTVGAVGFDAGANYVLNNGLGQVGGITLATVHGITGALTGYIIGGNGQSALAGAASGFVTELATPMTAQIANGNNNVLIGLNQIIGSLATGAATGNVNQAGLGANIAGLETQYNQALHGLHPLYSDGVYQATTDSESSKDGLCTTSGSYAVCQLLDSSTKAVNGYAIYDNGTWIGTQGAEVNALNWTPTQIASAVIQLQNMTSPTDPATLTTTISASGNNNSSPSTTNPDIPPTTPSNNLPSSSGLDGQQPTVSPLTLAIGNLGLSQDDTQKIINNLNLMAPQQQLDYLQSLQNGTISASNAVSSSLWAAAQNITGQYMTPSEQTHAVLGTLMVVPFVGEVAALANAGYTIDRASTGGTPTDTFSIGEAVGAALPYAVPKVITGISGLVNSSTDSAAVNLNSGQAILSSTGTITDTTANGTSTVYRVQGGIVPNASKTLITLDANGNPIIQDSTLNVSIGDASHAQYFQTLRPSSTVTSFEIPSWMDDFIQENAIPQYRYNSNPLNQGGLAPKIVDPTTPGRSYELPSPWGQWIQENAISGSGKVQK